MKARGAVLLLCAASAVLRAEDPDWFDAFKGRAFLQGDASFVASEKSAPPDAPPLFRARWVVIRHAGFTEKEREWWPYRNILLVTMPSGARYVVESSFGFVDEKHLEEERPWQRVASSRAAFEVWSGGASEDHGADAGPCAGMVHRVRAPGGTVAFFLEDLGSGTMRTTLAEITSATFLEEERRDLESLLRVSFDSNPTLAPEHLSLNVRSALFALVVAMRDRVLPPARRTAVLTPDPDPAGDLAPWRALAHLPLNLPPFPALPPESPIR